MEQTDTTIEPLNSVAEYLLSARVKAIEEVGGGRNSRVRKLTVDPLRAYALKSYFQHASDRRNRLRTEFDSLRFLWKNGITNVPRPVVASTEHSFAIYEWIDGQRIGTKDIDSATVSAANLFLADLQGLRSRPDSHSFEAASEACFSGRTLVENLQSRLKPLMSRDDQRDLKAFLSRDFVPACARIVDWSRERAGESFYTDLPEDMRILSPSDFGFHNALRCEGGQICFLDFEYFGWDDPAKTIADFLLHPAMALDSHQKRQFAAATLQPFSFVTDLVMRVRAYYPLFGLKWCLILLNEFLPDQLLRRRFAATKDQSVETQNEQLTKAKAMLSQTLSEYEHFPYFD